MNKKDFNKLQRKWYKKIKDQGFKDIESIPENKDLPYLQKPQRERALAADDAADLIEKETHRQLLIDIETELADKYRRFCYTGNDYLDAFQYLVLWEFYQNDLTIDQIINKEVPESAGYFWIVPQFMLLENSCVLLGANELTPTLTTSEAKSTTNQPEVEATEKEPEEENVFDFKKELQRTKIIF